MPAAYLLAATGLWAGGVGAFSISAGYMLAPYVHGQRRSSRAAAAIHCKAEPPPSPESGEPLLIRPPADPGALRTESQSRRLVPVNNLKRKRRSRKLRTNTVSEDKFVPLVPGAKQSTDESIIAAMLQGQEPPIVHPIRDGAIYLALISVVLAPTVVPVMQAALIELGMA